MAALLAERNLPAALCPPLFQLRELQRTEGCLGPGSVCPMQFALRENVCSPTGGLKMSLWDSEKQRLVAQGAPTRSRLNSRISPL